MSCFVPVQRFIASSPFSLTQTVRHPVHASQFLPSSKSIRRGPALGAERRGSRKARAQALQAPCLGHLGLRGVRRGQSSGAARLAPQRRRFARASLHPPPMAQGIATLLARGLSKLRELLPKEGPLKLPLQSVARVQAVSLLARMGYGYGALAQVAATGEGGRP